MKKSILVLFVIATLAMVGCNHKPVVPDDMFCFTAMEDGVGVSLNVEFPDQPTSQVSLVYSLDGKNWEDFIVGQTTVTLPKSGDKMYMKAKNENTTFSNFIGEAGYNVHVFQLSRKAKVSGNIMYLLNGDSPKDAQMGDFAFTTLFLGCENLVDASGLIMPATKLSMYCYASMFYGCKSLVKTPALPATALAIGCYEAMFGFCTSLQEAPALPALVLEEDCYNSMFYNCPSLVSAPALPATKLAPLCYEGMFCACTSLTAAPSLPVTELAERCYRGMFKDCTSLTQAPALPATTLVPSCYANMFQNCNSLLNITCKATDMSAEDCVKDWMAGITTTGTLHAASGTDWTGKIPDTWSVVFD